VTYSTSTSSAQALAGQAVAVRVTGDPDPTNNGLFYLHSDHLGSTSAMSDVNGNLVPDSTARYTPFGDWRTEPGTNPEITDRGYTGHAHNNSPNGSANDLGLIYMNARYYVPYLNRFISADTIVPDPANPQSFNRYSYVNNNPINYVDPSGHVAQLIEGGNGNCQNSLDCVYWDKEIHGELYGRPIGTKLEDVAQAKEQLGATGQVALAMACELCDWAMTGNAWRQGDFHWMDLAGLLPIVPGAAGRLARQSDTIGDIVRYGEDILDIRGPISIDDAIDQAVDFVGNSGWLEKTGKGTNFQFRSVTTNAQGDTIIRAGRLDVNMADSHVQKTGSHLNLQEWVNGVETQNLHLDIDPNTIRIGDFP
jgi:RHS repeat-associated protein